MPCCPVSSIVLCLLTRLPIRAKSQWHRPEALPRSPASWPRSHDARKVSPVGPIDSAVRLAGGWVVNAMCACRMLQAVRLNLVAAHRHRRQVSPPFAVEPHQECPVADFDDCPAVPFTWGTPRDPNPRANGDSTWIGHTVNGIGLAPDELYFCVNSTSRRASGLLPFTAPRAGRSAVVPRVMLQPAARSVPCAPKGHLRYDPGLRGRPATAS